MTKRTKPVSMTRRLTRRQLLGSAAAAPLVLAGCGEPAADDGPTLAALEQVNRLTNRPLSSDRLSAILPAVRRNHAFFRTVRELGISDFTEPAVRFVVQVPTPQGEGS